MTAREREKQRIAECLARRKRALAILEDYTETTKQAAWNEIAIERAKGDEFRLRRYLESGWRMLPTWVAERLAAERMKDVR